MEDTQTGIEGAVKRIQEVAAMLEPGRFRSSGLAMTRLEVEPCPDGCGHMKSLYIPPGQHSVVLRPGPCGHLVRTNCAGVAVETCRQCVPREPKRLSDIEISGDGPAAEVWRRLQSQRG